MITGIDISHWQGLVNWDLVNANPDIGFVIIKATEGIGWLDERFERNWELCKKPKAAYHFWRYSVDGKRQAQFYFNEVTRIIGDAKMRPVFDYEDPQAPTGANAPSALKEFHEEAQARWYGRTPIVYTRASWWDPIIGKDVCGSNPLWVAHYTDAAVPLLPKKGGWPKWAFWQYTSHGKVAGISGDVDMDRFAGTQEELNALLYFEGAEPPPPSGSDWDEARVAAIEEELAQLGAWKDRMRDSFGPP